jgi:hypothetical protein
MNEGMSLVVKAIKAKMANKKKARLVNVKIRLIADFARIAQNNGLSIEWLENVLFKARVISSRDYPEIADRKVVYSDNAIKILKAKNYYLAYVKDMNGFEHYLGYFVKH